METFDFFLLRPKVIQFPVEKEAERIEGTKIRNENHPLVEVRLVHPNEEKGKENGVRKDNK